MIFNDKLIRALRKTIPFIDEVEGYRYARITSRFSHNKKPVHFCLDVRYEPKTSYNEKNGKTVGENIREETIWFCRSSGFKSGVKYFLYGLDHDRLDPDYPEFDELDPFLTVFVNRLKAYIDLPEEEFRKTKRGLLMAAALSTKEGIAVLKDAITHNELKGD